MRTTTGRDVPVHLHESIDRLAARRPDAIAVTAAGRALVFAELAELSNRLAQYLRRVGVRAGDRVAVCLRPGPENLVAQIAVIKLGATAVVLDRDHPETWLAFLLDSVEARSLVTVTRTLDRLALDRGFPVALLDRDEWRAAPATDPRVPVTDDMVCHVSYPGRPGGTPRPVLRTHGQLRWREPATCLRALAAGGPVDPATGPARR